MNATNRAMFLWIVSMSLLVGLANCASPPEVSGPVVPYTSVPTGVIADIETAFVELQVFRAGTSDVVARLYDDGSPE